MEIATGYFARAKHYHDLGYSLVSIALRRPRFLPTDLFLHDMTELAPTQDILALKDHPNEYERRYREERLSMLSVPLLMELLREMAAQEEKDKVVLMCYEASDKFCHRHIVAKWLGEKLGQEVSEIKVECEPSKKKHKRR